MKNWILKEGLYHCLDNISFVKLQIKLQNKEFVNWKNCKKSE